MHMTFDLRNGSVHFALVRPSFLTLCTTTIMGYKTGTKREFYPRIDPFSLYTDTKFVQRYRLSKVAVRVLVKEYVATKQRKVLRDKHAVPHSLMFCIALRYFATGATYLTIGDVHGVSKSTVCRAVEGVSHFFHQHLQEYVHWPDTVEEKNNKAMRFYQESKKPKLFGLVDGTHIPIGCPKGLTKDENQYFCYKGYYSLNAMVIGDCDHVIMHVNASNPGSSNDIYVMNGSEIKYYGERNDYKGFYLLGDSGYVLTDYLLIPVKLERTRADVAYNKWHRKTRSKIERTIGILKQRWRCLDSSGGYLLHDPERAGNIVEACCCLHNCARVAKVKILKDQRSKDRFRAVQPEVVQPANRGQRDAVAFVNLRKDFIKDHFTPTRRVVARRVN